MKYNETFICLMETKITQNPFKKYGNVNTLGKAVIQN